jgi:mannosyltransferase OCH1-like enzyme
MYPKIIYLCNKKINEKDIIASSKWKMLNPEYEIRLYDDELIKLFLEREYGELYKNIFNFLKDGPIKSDFWRICILYKYGGVYSDIDNIPFIKLSDFIENDIDFVTCSSYWDKFKYNPNFIISSKNNIILKNCINWYIHKYMNNHIYNYWDWSIMNAFSQLLHLNNYNKKWGIYKVHDMNIQIIEEIQGKEHYDDHNIYNNKRVFNNRSEHWDFNLHTFI